METVMTLVYPVTSRRILLGLKKQRIGQGTLVGFGGRVEPGETIKAAAVRELKEESGLIAFASDLIPCGMLSVIDPKYPALGTFRIHVYVLEDWSGRPIETEEMAPSWFYKSRIPWKRMRESERYWLPAVINGHQVSAKIEYDQAGTIQQASIEIR